MPQKSEIIICIKKLRSADAWYYFEVSSSSETIKFGMDDFMKIYNASSEDINYDTAPSCADNLNNSLTTTSPSLERKCTKDISLLEEKMVELGFEKSIQSITEEQFYLTIKIGDGCEEWLNFEWERLNALSNLIVHRSLMMEKINIQNYNILLAMSHAYNYDKRNKIYNELGEQFMKIIEICFSQKKDLPKENIPVDYLEIARHLTMDALEKIKGEYKIIHIALHGSDDGQILLERDDNITSPNYCTDDTFLEKFSAKTDVVYLDFCFSGYSEKNRPSLAIKALQKGLCNSVIAHNGSIGSTKTAPKFSKIFYSKLFDKNFDIKTAYIGAKEELIREGNKYTNIIYLYDKF